MHLDEKLDDVPGDLVSRYDPTSRRGFHLTLKSNAGVANTQANYRQLQFGIDNAAKVPGPIAAAPATPSWPSRWRRSTAIFMPARASRARTNRAASIASTANTSGSIAAAPAACNAVTAMAECDGKLYAGVGKYRLAGSALPESKNANLGGRVLRYDGGTNWTDCGQLPGVEAVGGMVVFRGQLYASISLSAGGILSLRRRHDVDRLRHARRRVEALGVYNGYLWATSYDGGHGLSLRRNTLDRLRAARRCPSRTPRPIRSPSIAGGSMSAPGAAAACIASKTSTAGPTLAGWAKSWK